MAVMLRMNGTSTKLPKSINQCAVSHAWLFWVKTLSVQQRNLGVFYQMKKFENLLLKNIENCTTVKSHWTALRAFFDMYQVRV